MLFLYLIDNAEGAATLTPPTTIPGPKKSISDSIFDKMGDEILSVTTKIIHSGDMNSMTVGQVLKEIADVLNLDFDENQKVKIRAVIKKVVSELLAAKNVMLKKTTALEAASKKRKLPEKDTSKKVTVPERPIHERVVPLRTKKQDSGNYHSDLPDSRKSMRDPEAKNDVYNIINDAKKSFTKNGTFHDTRRRNDAHKESNSLLEMLSNVASNENEYSINLSDYSDDEAPKISKGSSALFFIGVF